MVSLPAVLWSEGRTVYLVPSGGLIQPCCRHLSEASPIAFENRLAARQRLPASDHDVNIAGIQFHSTADPIRLFRCHECGAAAEKRLVHEFAPPGVVQNRTPHQLHRLLGRMIELLLLGTAHHELGGWGTPDGRVLAGFAIPGSVLPSHVPAGLMLKPVMGPRQDHAALVPDDLLMMLKADPQKSVQN